ncbi:MAG: cyclic nucleotide-binding domain-containing protein [Actinobacteria bacterium]|nr:cyclic nucleotide-binding domain-containing protein [Actinomycetota bacterium]
MAQSREELLDLLAGLTLFADLAPPQLEAAVHTFDEEWFGEGQRVLRQGMSGTGFYVILEGQAAVRIDGEDRATLGRGEFFGEVSALLDDQPVADVVAVTPLRCLVLHKAELESFLLAHPTVMLRMLQAEARRLRSANRWRG